MIHALFLVTYLILVIAVFVYLRAASYLFPNPVSALDFLLLCLATFRLTALITEDRIFRFLRAPFVTENTVQAEDGTKTVKEKPAGRGVRRVIGELILCPWCAGIWIATVLVFARILFPDAASALLLVLSAAAGAILIQIAGKLMDRAREFLKER
jgi:uncharacterized protein DUF1360